MRPTCETESPLDVVYVWGYGGHRDLELRFSLRSVDRHLRWIRKVWIFGDRPDWMRDDVDLIEHVPHSEVAWIPGFATPVVNHFLLYCLVAMLPDVSPEFMQFSDDYVLLDDMTPERASTVWYLQDLDAVSGDRGTGAYKDAIWRNYELLRRLGYPRLNYECHVPLRMTKRRILAAARDFREHLSEDRFGGPLAQLTIMNHARLRENFTPMNLPESGLFAGLHFRGFTYSEIESICANKLYLNFDDVAFNVELIRFLEDRFPEPSRYERVVGSG